MNHQKDIRPALRRHYERSGVTLEEYARELGKTIGLRVARSTVEKWLAPNGKKKPLAATAALIRRLVDLSTPFGQMGRGYSSTGG